MLLVGASKSEINYRGEGHGMMGYGRFFNIIKGYLTPLYSRAFCFKDTETGQKIFFLNAEICLVLPELKRETLNRLHRSHPDKNFTDANVMITAQHTHSAPGGFSHYPFYNWSIPGYIPEVFDAFVHCFYEALLEADANVQPAVLKFGQDDFHPEDEVGFQRSLKAYNRNPEVKKCAETETHLAMERTMFLLKIETPEGKPIGQINWFGVHTTSLGNKVCKVGADNKGYASTYTEEFMGEDAIAVFAQQFAGDISPNFHGKGKNWPKGKYKDDIKSAEFNGYLQFRKAKDILGDLKKSSILKSTELDCEIIYRDFSKIKIDEDFNQGDPDAQTSAACHGVGFLKGTPVDGKGSPHGITELAISISRSLRTAELAMSKVWPDHLRKEIEIKYKTQDPKDILMEPGVGEILGTKDIRNLVVPGIIDGGIMEMKRQHRIGAMKELPWTPAVLPLQYFRIGKIAIIGFPGEITTVAGQQLRELIRTELSGIGVEEVIISSYANSYLGYCTTYHEYFEQCYEGGHTVFGKWTLDAFKTEYRKFMREVVKPKSERKFPASPHPKIFSKEELELRTWKPKNKKLKSGKRVSE